MTNAEEKISRLETELRAAQELLYLVLVEVDQPVVLNAAESRERMQEERVIDLSLDEEAGTWTLQVIEVE